MKMQRVRILALVVVLVFTTNTIVLSAPPVYTFTVPQKHGIVVQRHKGEHDKLIIHVQDAHSSLEAQKNIAQILCALVKQIDAADVPVEPWVGVEGAVGKYDLDSARNFPIYAVKQLVGEDYVRDGKLIASELAAMLSEHRFALFGIENEQIFSKNFKSFYYVASRHDHIHHTLHQITSRFAKIKQTIYNPMLQAFDDQCVAFENSTLSLSDYFQLIIPYVESGRYSVERYATLVTFYEALKAMSNVDWEAFDEDLVVLQQTRDADHPVQYYVRACRAAVRKQEYMSIPIEYLSHILQFAYMNDYKDQTLLLKHVQHIRRQQALCDTRSLLHEINDFMHEVRIAHSKTSIERELISLWRTFTRARMLMSLQAERETVEEYFDDPQLFDLRNIYSELESIARKKLIALLPVTFQVDSSMIMHHITSFYNAAHAREMHMVENIVREMDATGQKIGVLVAGGYHSSHLVDLIRKKGYSYMLVAPKVNNLDHDVAYMNRMLGKVAPIDPVLISTLQTSYLQGSLQALSSFAFEGILTEVERDLLGQTFLNEQGRVMDREELERILTLLDREAENGSRIAKAARLIYDEIHGPRGQAVIMQNRTNIDGLEEELVRLLRERIGREVMRQVDLSAFHEAFIHAVDSIASPDQVLSSNDKMNINAETNVLQNVISFDDTLPGKRTIVHELHYAAEDLPMRVITYGRDFQIAQLSQTNPINNVRPFKISRYVLRGGYAGTFSVGAQVIEKVLNTAPINIVILQKHNTVIHNTISIIRELQRQSDTARILLVTDKNWLDIRDDGQVFVRQALVFNQKQNKQLAFQLQLFHEPLAAHYIAIRASKTWKAFPFLKKISVPISENRYFEMLATNKIKTNRALAKRGIRVPENISFVREYRRDHFAAIDDGTLHQYPNKFVFLPANVHMHDVLASVKEFRKKHKYVVVKPSGGSMGKGVRLFDPDISDREIARYIIGLLTKKRRTRESGKRAVDISDDVILEERIAPPYFRKGKYLIDWNLRVTVSRNERNEPQVSAIVVRCGRKGGPINISQKAFTTNFTMLAKYLKMKPKEMRALRRSIQTTAVRAFKAIEDTAITGRIIPSHQQQDFSGIDIIVKKDMDGYEPVVIEVNGKNSGGVWHYDEYHRKKKRHGRIGKATRLFARTMIRRAQEYKLLSDEKESNEKNIVLPQLPPQAPSGSIFAAFDSLLENPQLAIRHFTRKDFQQIRINPDTQMPFSLNTIVAELKGLITVGIVTMNEDERPYRYRMNDEVSRLSDESIYTIREALNQLPAQPTVEQIQEIKTLIACELERSVAHDEKLAVKGRREFWPEESCRLIENKNNIEPDDDAFVIARLRLTSNGTFKDIDVRQKRKFVPQGKKTGTILLRILKEIDEKIFPRYPFKLILGELKYLEDVEIMIVEGRHDTQGRLLKYEIDHSVRRITIHHDLFKCSELLFMKMEYAMHQLLIHDLLKSPPPLIIQEFYSVLIEIRRFSKYSERKQAKVLDFLQSHELEHSQALYTLLKEVLHAIETDTIKRSIRSRNDRNIVISMIKNYVIQKWKNSLLAHRLPADIDQKRLNDIKERVNGLIQSIARELSVAAIFRSQSAYRRHEAVNYLIRNLSYRLEPHDIKRHNQHIFMGSTRIRIGNKLLDLKQQFPDPYFSSDDFRYGFRIQSLCKKINEYDAELEAVDNSIERLNEFLHTEGFYWQWRRKGLHKNVKLSPVAKRLVKHVQSKAFEKLPEDEQNRAVALLNRLILQETYTKKCPKLATLHYYNLGSGKIVLSDGVKALTIEKVIFVPESYEEALEVIKKTELDARIRQHVKILQKKRTYKNENDEVVWNIARDNIVSTLRVPFLVIGSRIYRLAHEDMSLDLSALVDDPWLWLGNEALVNFFGQEKMRDDMRFTKEPSNKMIGINVPERLFQQVLPTGILKHTMQKAHDYLGMPVEDTRLLLRAHYALVLNRASEFQEHKKAIDEQKHLAEASDRIKDCMECLSQYLHFEHAFNVLSGLNDDQYKAVTSYNKKHVIVMANAGSGKTRVLTRRIGYLLGVKREEPKSLLAVTFSKAAAEEMATRVEKLIGTDKEVMDIRTFNAFGYQLLKEHGYKIGMQKELRVVSEQQQIAILLDILAEQNFTHLKNKDVSHMIDFFDELKAQLVFPEQFGAYIDEKKNALDDAWRVRAYEYPDEEINAHALKRLKQQIADTKNALSEEDRTAKEAHVQFLTEVLRVQILSELAVVYVEYQKQLHMQGLVDFGDQIMQAVRLVRDMPSVLSSLHQRYNHILIDEFQDTNFAQAELLKLIAGTETNIFVVGDPDQSIFQFRGAFPFVFEWFRQQYPDHEFIEMHENYRSTQRILSTATQFIIPSDGEHTKRKFPFAVRGYGTKVILNEVRTQPGTWRKDDIKLLPHAEARAIVDYLQSMQMKNKVSYHDMAILYRKHSQSKPITDELNRRGVPFTVIGERGFAEREEIRDVVAYLNLIQNYTDEVALYRILTSSMWNCTRAEWLELVTFARHKKISLFESLRFARDINTIAPATRMRMSQCYTYILKLMDEAINAPAHEIVKKLVYFYEYSMQIERMSSDVIDQKRAYLRFLQDKARLFVDLETFLQEVDMVDYVPGIERTHKGVQLMTMHAAKGLEFPHVVIAGLNAGAFPSRFQPNMFVVPDDLHAWGMHNSKDEHVQAERNIFYVGMTRAMDTLALFGTHVMPDKSASIRARNVSPFFEEVRRYSNPKFIEHTIHEISGEEYQLEKPVSEELYVKAVLKKLLYEMGLAMRSGLVGLAWSLMSRAKQDDWFVSTYGMLVRYLIGILRLQYLGVAKLNEECNPHDIMDTIERSLQIMIRTPHFFSQKRKRQQLIKSMQQRAIKREVIKERDRYSYSRFNQFARDIERHDMLYHLFFPWSYENGVYHRRKFGIIMHEMVARFYRDHGELITATYARDEKSIAQALQAVFEAVWRKHRYVDAQDAQTFDDMFYEQAQHSLISFAHALARGPRVNRVECEKPFKIIIAGFEVVGYIDRIEYLADGTVRIIDFKTRLPFDGERTQVQLHDNVQLLLYALALQKQGFDVSKMHVGIGFLKKATPENESGYDEIFVEPRIHDVQALERKVLSYIIDDQLPRRFGKAAVDFDSIFSDVRLRSGMQQEAMSSYLNKNSGAFDLTSFTLPSADTKVSIGKTKLLLGVFYDQPHSVTMTRLQAGVVMLTGQGQFLVVEKAWIQGKPYMRIGKKMYELAHDDAIVNLSNIVLDTAIPFNKALRDFVYAVNSANGAIQYERGPPGIVWHEKRDRETERAKRDYIEAHFKPFVSPFERRMRQWIAQFNTYKDPDAIVTFTGKPLLAILPTQFSVVQFLYHRIRHVLRTTDEEMLIIAKSRNEKEILTHAINMVTGTESYRVNVTTLHGIAFMLLQRYGDRIGLRSWETVSDVQERMLLRGIITRLKKAKGVHVEYFAHTSYDNLETLRVFINRAKRNLWSPADFLSVHVHDLQQQLESNRLLMSDAEREDAERTIAIAKEAGFIYREYQRYAFKSGRLSFSDFVYYAYKLLHEQPRIAEEMRERFAHIAVSNIHARSISETAFVKLLCGDKNPNAVLVGVQHQGASDDYLDPLKAFEYLQERFPSLVIKRVRYNNYNSPQIWNAAHLILDEEERSQILKEDVVVTAKEGQSVKVMSVDSRKTEDYVIVQEIKKLFASQPSERRAYQKCAIYYRSMDDIEELIALLKESKIPYSVHYSTALFHQEDVRKIISLLKAVIAQETIEDIVRICRDPEWGIDYFDAQRIARYCSSKKIPFYRIADNVGILRFRDHNTITRLNQIMQLLDQLKQSDSDVRETVKLLLKKTDYFQRVANQYVHAMDANITGVAWFCRYIENYVSSVMSGKRDISVNGFLKYLDAYVEAGGIRSKQEHVENTFDLGGVQILPLWRAKQEVFPYVFLKNYFSPRRAGRPDIISQPWVEGDYRRANEQRELFTLFTNTSRRLYLTQVGYVPTWFQKQVISSNQSIVEQEITKQDISFNVTDSEVRQYKPMIGELMQKINAIDRRPHDNVIITEWIHDTAIFLWRVMQYEFLRSSTEGLSMDVLSAFDARLLPLIREELKAVAAYATSAENQDRVLTLLNNPVEGVEVIRHPLLFMSFSQLKQYLQCPQAFWFHYVMRIKDKKIAATVFGNHIHTVIEEVFKRIQKGHKPHKKEIQAYYIEKWPDHNFDNTYDEAEYKKQGITLLDQFYDAAVAPFNMNERMQHRNEVPFEVTIGGQLFKGVIDHIIFDAQGRVLEIIDYKTGKPKMQKDADKDYQLTVYACASRKLFGRVPEKVTFWNLTDNSRVSSVRSEKDIHELEDVVRDVVARIRNNDFKPLPSLLCNLCSYYGLCDAVKKIQDRRRADNGILAQLPLSLYGKLLDMRPSIDALLTLAGDAFKITDDYQTLGEYVRDLDGLYRPYIASAIEGEEFSLEVDAFKRKTVMLRSSAKFVEEHDAWLDKGNSDRIVINQHVWDRLTDQKRLMLLASKIIMSEYLRLYGTDVPALERAKEFGVRAEQAILRFRSSSAIPGIIVDGVRVNDALWATLMYYVRKSLSRYIGLLHLMRRDNKRILITEREGVVADDTTAVIIVPVLEAAKTGDREAIARIERIFRKLHYSDDELNFGTHAYDWISAMRMRVQSLIKAYDEAVPVPIKTLYELLHAEESTAIIESLCKEIMLRYYGALAHTNMFASGIHERYVTDAYADERAKIELDASTEQEKVLQELFVMVLADMHRTIYDDDVLHVLGAFRALLTIDITAVWEPFAQNIPLFDLFAQADPGHAWFSNSALHEALDMVVYKKMGFAQSVSTFQECQPEPVTQKLKVYLQEDMASSVVGRLIVGGIHPYIAITSTKQEADILIAFANDDAPVGSLQFDTVFDKAVLQLMILNCFAEYAYPYIQDGWTIDQLREKWVIEKKDGYMFHPEIYEGMRTVTQVWYRQIRADNEKREDNLAPYACRSVEAVRLHPYSDIVPTAESMQPIFAQDKYRIMHSRAYSRYRDKTQVFFQFKNDHLTTRALHVQLVADIARKIARALRLNEDLCEAIALGHDVGHTPFGHEGEHFLNRMCKEHGIGAFYHNVQSARIFLELEERGKGLNLSLQVIDGILAHNGEILSRRYEPGQLKTWEQLLQEYEHAMQKKDFSKKIMPMTLEGCVMRIADVIAYAGRDFEDAIRVGMVERKDLPDDVARILGRTNTEIENTLILDLIKNSYGKPYLEFSEEVYMALEKLKAFNYRYVYRNPAMKSEYEMGNMQRMFEGVYAKCLRDAENNDPESGIVQHFLIHKSDEYKERTPIDRQVVDYIAGMTDTFFRDQAQVLGLPVPTRYGYDIRDNDEFQAKRRSMLAEDDHKKKIPEGSLYNAYVALQRAGFFSDHTFTRGDVQFGIGRTHTKTNMPFSYKTVATELEGLTSLGILIAERSKRPFHYQFAPALLRAPPEVLMMTGDVLATLPANPTPAQLESVASHISMLVLPFKKQSTLDLLENNNPSEPITTNSVLSQMIKCAELILLCGTMINVPVGFMAALIERDVVWLLRFLSKEVCISFLTEVGVSAAHTVCVLPNSNNDERKKAMLHRQKARRVLQDVDTILTRIDDAHDIEQALNLSLIHKALHLRGKLYIAVVAEIVSHILKRNGANESTCKYYSKIAYDTYSALLQDKVYAKWNGLTKLLQMRKKRMHHEFKMPSFSVQPSYTVRELEKYFMGKSLFAMCMRGVIRLALSPWVFPHELGNLVQSVFTGRWRDMRMNFFDLFSGLRFLGKTPLCIGGLVANTCLTILTFSLSAPWYVYAYAIGGVVFVAAEVIINAYRYAYPIPSLEAGGNVHTVKIQLNPRDNYPLTVRYGLPRVKSILMHRWKKLCEGFRYVSIQQIGFAPTYLCVVSDNEKIMHEFKRELVLTAPVWKEFLRCNWTATIENGKVRALKGYRLIIDSAMTRHMQSVLNVVRRQIDTEGRIENYKSALVAKLPDTAFWLQHKPDIANDIQRDRVACVGGQIDNQNNYVLLWGEVEQDEAQSIFQDIMIRNPDLLRAAGNVVIKVNDATVTVHAEHIRDGVGQELKRYVEQCLRTIVLSDIHLGGNQLTGKKVAELCVLLEDIVNTRALLVLNGDILELWQTRYRKIKQQYPQVFYLLKQVRRIIYLAGNHDRSILPEETLHERQQTLEVAKKNVIRNRRKQRALNELCAKAIGQFNLQQLQQGIVLLSHGFTRQKIARDNSTYYFDEFILLYARDKGKAKAVRLIAKLVRDIHENLNERVQNDLPQVSIRKYYNNVRRGLYCEHGHVSDPYNYQSIVGLIISGVVGSIGKLGWRRLEVDLEFGLLGRIKYLAGRFMPGLLIRKSHSNNLERILTVGAALQDYRAYTMHKCVHPYTILTGHTHVPRALGESYLHHFSEYFNGIAYGNCGSWSARTQLNNDRKDWFEIPFGKSPFLRNGANGNFSKHSKLQNDLELPQQNALLPNIFVRAMRWVRAKNFYGLLLTTIIAAMYVLREHSSWLTYLPGWVNAILFYTLADVIRNVSLMIKGQVVLLREWWKTVWFMPMVVGGVIGITTEIACTIYNDVLPLLNVGVPFMRTLFHSWVTAIMLGTWIVITNGIYDTWSEFKNQIKRHSIKGGIGVLGTIWRERRLNFFTWICIGFPFWFFVNLYVFSLGATGSFMTAVIAMFSVPWALLTVAILNGTSQKRPAFIERFALVVKPEHFLGFALGAGCVFYGMYYGVAYNVYGIVSLHAMWGVVAAGFLGAALVHKMPYMFPLIKRPLNSHYSRLLSAKQQAKVQNRLNALSTEGILNVNGRHYSLGEGIVACVQDHLRSAVTMRSVFVQCSMLWAPDPHDLDVLVVIEGDHPFTSLTHLPYEINMPGYTVPLDIHYVGEASLNDIGHLANYRFGMILYGDDLFKQVPPTTLQQNFYYYMAVRYFDKIERLWNESKQRKILHRLLYAAHYVFLGTHAQKTETIMRTLIMMCWEKQYKRDELHGFSVALVKMLKEHNLLVYRIALITHRLEQWLLDCEDITPALVNDFIIRNHGSEYAFYIVKNVLEGFTYWYPDHTQTIDVLQRMVQGGYTTQLDISRIKPVSAKQPIETVVSLSSGQFEQRVREMFFNPVNRGIYAQANAITEKYRQDKRLMYLIVTKSNFSNAEIAKVIADAQRQGIRIVMLENLLQRKEILPTLHVAFFVGTNMHEVKRMRQAVAGLNLQSFVILNYNANQRTFIFYYFPYVLSALLAGSGEISLHASDGAMPDMASIADDPQAASIIEYMRNSFKTHLVDSAA